MKINSIIAFAAVAVLASCTAKVSEDAVCGRVSCDGKGVKGVWVTDGSTWAKTDWKGRYTLEVNDTADFVYISVPSGYEAPAGKYSPKFYIPVSELEASADFEIVKSCKADEFILANWADVQAYVPEDLEHVRKAAADLKQLKEKSGLPVYGMVGGDIIGERNWTPLMFEPTSEAMNEAGISFYYLCGNHDLDLGIKCDHDAKVSYRSLYGPTYYSFNIGRIHFIVMDNVYAMGDWNTKGYIGPKQLEWISEDLSHVKKGSTVVVCSHIPTWSIEARLGDFEHENPRQVTEDREALYELLKPYNAHIFANHQHHAENHLLRDNLFEHVIPPVSGLFWQSLLSWDGLPYGYMVYHFKGDSLDWYWRAVGSEDDIQCSFYNVGEDPIRKDCVVVNAWNYDTGWKVEYWEDGEYKGDMERFKGYDAAIVNDVKANRSKFRWDYIGAGPTWHMFSAKPSEGCKVVTCKVTDRFGNSWSKDLQIDMQ